MISDCSEIFGYWFWHLLSYAMTSFELSRDLTFLITRTESGLVESFHKAGVR